MKVTLDRLIYDLMYRLRKPVWDTGIAPPEVIAAIDHTSTPGRALDLGCGTGTDSIFFAQRGWDVVAADFSPQAIATAREKAKRAGVNVDFRVADVTRLDDLTGPFDLALDVGCFHGLDAAGRARYAEQLAQLLRPGARFMLWGFDRPALFENYGIPRKTVLRLFTPHFSMDRAVHNQFRGRPTSWYWFTRR